MRDFEPVPPIEWPERLSQTLLARADLCPRSSYLYVKHGGGLPSHPMDRGSAFHAGVARATLELVEQAAAVPAGGDFVPSEEELAVQMGRTEPDVVKAWVEEEIAAHPEWVVPLFERERLRQMAYHWAAFGHPLDPRMVVGVERKFVLPVLDGRWVLSGVLDVVLRDGPELDVRDYKTSPSMPSLEVFERSFQTPFYGVLAMLGKPVTRRQCPSCKPPALIAPDAEPVPDCAVCDGRGYLETVAPFGVGDGAQAVRVSEQYPALNPKKTLSGKVAERATVLSRAQVLEKLSDIEAKVEELDGRLSTWDFPARDGTWCHECAAPQECPIDPLLREPVTDRAGAEEAALVWKRASEQAAKSKRLVKEWAKANGVDLVRVGPDGDEALVFSQSESQSVKDWEKLDVAITDAAEYGKPFSRGEHVSVRKSTRFDRRKLEPGELNGENDAA